MKKKLVFLSAVLFGLLVASCSSDNSSDDDYLDTPISDVGSVSVGGSVTGVAPANGFKFYTFTVSTAGSYYFTLSGLSTDCAMTICNYDSSAVILRDLVDDILWDFDTYSDSSSEHGAYPLSAGQYYIVIQNFWDVDSSLNLSISSVSSSVGSISDVEESSFSTKQDFTAKWFCK